MSTLGLLGLGVAGGFLGSVLGLGGGVVLVPGLTLLFGFPLREAVAVSLVGIAATSAAAAANYLEAGRVDVPLALRLETVAVLGAVGASLSAHLVPESVLYLAFAVVVLYAAAAMTDLGPTRRAEPAEGPAQVRRLGVGMAGSGGAGVASALLGIGGGVAKVPLMHLVMGVPLQVATGTSAFMVGMTAAAGGWVHWLHGDLTVSAGATVALGVLAGSHLGSRLSGRIPDRALRWVLAAVLLYVAGRMGWTGLVGPGP